MGTLATTANGPASVPLESRRIASIDLVRGAVMVLMALDHVRVFSGIPAGGSDPAVFLTRWVTHFCAPAFVFFAGTAAFLHGLDLGNRTQLSRFLLIRGAWLIVLELTFLRFAWTFNFDYAHYVLAGVIWVIGLCMILMAALSRLPLAFVAAFGAIIIGAHNLVDPHLPQLVSALRQGHIAWYWQLLYFGGPVRIGNSSSHLAVLYSLVPWIGVMAAGYAFGAVMRMERPQRHRLCLVLGLGATAVFLLLRGFNLYGNPSPWTPADPRLSPWLSFLNLNKYPASLLFLLMTLGPTLALLPLLERASGPPTRVLAVFGRVPLFFYLLHIPLIHAIAAGVSLVRLGEVSPWLRANHPMMNPPPPPGYTWSLPLLYLVAVGVVALLYVPCRWFAEFKRTRPESWWSLL
jgi:uncharacterized membrane protein